MTVQYLEPGKGAAAISEGFEAAIGAGEVRPGERLPPVRALARSLGVSPATVASAYRRLRDRGLVVAEGRRGTRVPGRPPLHTTVGPGVPPGGVDLASGNPDPDLLPALGPVLAGLEVHPHLYGEPSHRPDLLDLAARSLADDGVPTSSLAVVGGALDGIERALQAHLRAGDRVAVEDPGYTGVIDLVPALGLALEPVAVDDAGPQPDPLARALSRGALACIVTPRAHNPTGAAIDGDRAADLLSVLARYPGVLVIEDDHAGSVAGAPAHPLWQPGRERWAVVRSVSKSLGPDLRVAVMAGDPVTMARVEGRQALGTGWVSHLLQGMVARLWSDRSTPALLARASDTYRSRRQALLDALAGHGIEAKGRSGLNVWVPVPEESAVVTAMREDGWAVAPGERFRLASPPAVRVTTARLPEEEAPAVAASLAAAVGGSRRRTRSA